MNITESENENRTEKKIIIFVTEQRAAHHNMNFKWVPEHKMCVFKFRTQFLYSFYLYIYIFLIMNRSEQFIRIRVVYIICFAFVLHKLESNANNTYP